MAVDLPALGRAVKQTQYRNHRALDTALAAVGTTLAQWDALRAIARTPGSSAHFLAGETFQSDQAFGTLVGRLISQGLVDRMPGRGRAIEHRLTAEGERVLAAGQPVAERVARQTFAGLTDDEQQQLLDLLRRNLGEP
jgi:DNA-binding MarR family transcriptional regulator